MKAAILINQLSENALPDELDVLNEAQVFENALQNLGFTTKRFFAGLNLEAVRQEIEMYQPDLAVNMFEGIKGKPELIYLGPGLLQSMNIPYTGCGVDSIFITSNKILTKKILKSNNIPTAEWFEAKEIEKLQNDKTYIIKPLFEDASVGISKKSIIKGFQKEIIEEYRHHYNHHFFAEEFIDGREFNISLLSTPQGVKMLSPAEIKFVDFPEDMPKILDYAAKWNEETFEYKHTLRTFDFEESDKALLNEIEKIVIKCWQVFNLHGYARVDFRVDKNNKPFVLEINANPCISEDSGFYAACLNTGIHFQTAVEYILNDLND
ncbi:MAG TPA: ATP-grasp domain-containing protein [Bacteroidales bacterium]|jgi:D-alanine-D-alanine ligase|nr:ATP-grasp domain-containing protein [Bacteroidales bacterium]HOU98052.1 ATP-grasp domain-containing protein [Bacteroidales bacterium]